MKATKQTTEINGLTFSRWAYRGKHADERNANSPWTHELTVNELDGGLVGTGEKIAAEIQVWPVMDGIKIAGADSFDAAGAKAFAEALAAAAQLLREFNMSERCPAHGTLNDLDSPAIDCAACFEEMEAELDAAQANAR